LKRRITSLLWGQRLMTFNNKTHIFGSLWCLIATGLIEYSYTEKLYNIPRPIVINYRYLAFHITV
jgi:hypothetical protein